MPASPSHGRRGRPWRRLRAHLLAHATPVCALCGRAVDTSLPGTHPDGPQLDHRTPLSRGGAPQDPANLRLTHARCNAAKGARTEQPHSRRW